MSNVFTHTYMYRYGTKAPLKIYCMRCTSVWGCGCEGVGSTGGSGLFFLILLYLALLRQDLSVTQQGISDSGRVTGGQDLGIPSLPGITGAQLSNSSLPSLGDGNSGFHAGVASSLLG